MKIAQLKSLAKQGESETLEFKTSTANLSAGMKTVCAFLNSEHGGTVVFGITNKGKIVGQEITDKTLQAIAVEIGRIEPYANIRIEYVSVKDNLQVVLFMVTPDRKAPYTYDGRSYMRRQSTTIDMPREEVQYLYNKNNPSLWESQLNDKCTIKDLDHNRIKYVIRRAVTEKRLPEDALDLTVPEILKKLNLTVGNKLTNAAVILFCKDEDKQFMQSMIKLARFRGTDKSEFLDSKEYRGNAFDLYEKADAFLVFVLPLAAHTKGGQYRVETPAIPYSVLREALINALAHRNYSYAGGSIDIAIYDDRVEIVNNGNLPHGISVKMLARVHKSVPRNPLIANVFYLCHMIERWGRGTLDMIKDCEAAGNPLPIYKEEGDVFSVILPLKTPMRTVVYKEEGKSGLTALQQEIINVLQQGPLNRVQIMEKLGTELADRTIQAELTKLKNMGLITSKGRTKTTIWRLVD